MMPLRQRRAMTAILIQRNNRRRRLAAAGDLPWDPDAGGPEVPENALLNEDGTPITNEDETPITNE